MVQTCHRCSRVNPEEAAYCYFDGSALDGRGVNGGPVQTGQQAFHSPFTFPSGKACHNFDQLALACQENWAETLELLQQGYLETFLGSLGRADLALAAREAARYPDNDRGLDEFLAKLPSDVLAPPQLEVEPTEVNLGQLRPGEDRDLELHLTNQGMRLLYGSVICENCVWLTVGEGPGAPQKFFEFTDELDVPVHIRGQHLRASNQPLEGLLLVESNGGSATVRVRAEVPVKPFPDGLFGGARTPREVAERARENLRTRQHLKETAALFEGGAVARWYEDNGWTYPVQGPVAERTAAVQQFFDALGLSRPPQVELSPSSVALQGAAGAPLQYNLEIHTHERRPIYAHGSSDQPWVEVGRARLNGRTAVLTVPLVIPSVPDRQGETLRATVTIVANGKQRFTVPVTVEVGASFNFDTAATPEPAPAPAAPSSPAPDEPPAVPPDVWRRRWIHAAPAAALALALLAVILWDVFRGPPARVTRPPDRYYNIDLIDPEPRIGVKFSNRGRFGIVMIDPQNPENHKQLTRDEDGGTNNTCIRLDGLYENLFGQPPGEWARGARGQPLNRLPVGKGRRGWVSTWDYTREHIQVRQTVEIVPNDQTRLLDTCLVHYRIDNQDTIPHKVGLRVMIDTFIGSNDGVPFAIPGRPGLLETWESFPEKKIPDYIQALERSDLKDPGTVAHMGLKLQGIKIQPDDPELDKLQRLVICRWPGSDKKWQWDYRPMNESAPGEPADKDSCVVLYWPEETMAPDAKRAMAFTYGLGLISSVGSGNSKLSLTAGGSFQPGKVFTVTAYVKDPEAGQKVKLLLPRGLTLDEDQRDEQGVDRGTDYTQVSWRVRIDPKAESGDYAVSVTSGLEQERLIVRINKKSIFD